MTRADDTAEVSEDPCPEFLGVGFPPCLAQGDSEIGLADEGVRVVPAKDSRAAAKWSGAPAPRPHRGPRSRRGS